MTTVLPVHLPEGPFAVVTDGLKKHFGGEPALRGVDLQVVEEAVYVLVGPNGAGKTTTLKILLDLVRADEGRVDVFGLDPRAQGSRVRAQVGYVPDERHWGYGWMTVRRLLAHHAEFFPTWDRSYAEALTQTFQLRLDRRFGKLSRGEARRVQLVLALAHRPPLLLLDEPTDGLDPAIRDQTLGVLIDHVAETPTTVLISTHRVYEVDRLADYVGVMHSGRLLTQVSREALHRHLRRYRAAVPEDWSGAVDLNGRVIHRSVIGREIQWLVWGAEDEIAATLTLCGAVVQDSAPVSLEDAMVALLGYAEETA